MSRGGFDGDGEGGFFDDRIDQRRNCSPDFRILISVSLSNCVVCVDLKENLDVSRALLYSCPMSIHPQNRGTRMIFASAESCCFVLPYAFLSASGHNIA